MTTGSNWLAATPGKLSSVTAQPNSERDGSVSRPLTRVSAVCLLLVLAPVGAEYLLGYDNSTGDPVRLATSLLIFVPLYGAPAALIRDLARRRGRGWRTMLCWCAAWGVVQAGVVDQSIFNPDYRGIEYWDYIWAPTEVVGVSVFAALTFVLGHVIFSLAAPIALVEGIFPKIADQPWLRPWSLTALLLLGGLRGRSWPTTRNRTSRSALHPVSSGRALRSSSC